MRWLRDLLRYHHIDAQVVDEEVLGLADLLRIDFADRDTAIEIRSHRNNLARHDIAAYMVLEITGGALGFHEQDTNGVIIQRTPFYENWILAHEVGHALGLSDLSVDDVDRVMHPGLSASGSSGPSISSGLIAEEVEMMLNSDFMYDCT